MYEKLDQNASLVSWMIAGGARLDEPDARHIGHLVAIRDAKRDAGSTSVVARLTAWFGIRPSVTAAASSAAAVTSTTSATSCCAPA